MAMFLLPGEIRASALRDMIEAVMVAVSENNEDQVFIEYKSGVPHLLSIPPCMFLYFRILLFWYRSGG